MDDWIRLIACGCEERRESVEEQKEIYLCKGACLPGRSCKVQVEAVVASGSCLEGTYVVSVPLIRQQRMLERNSLPVWDA